jgi:hypothetical protein
MKASGTFNVLYRFLALLENSPYELEFIGVNMDNGVVLDTVGKNVAASKWNAIFKVKLLSFIQ